jgi:hypothetical protein
MLRERPLGSTAGAGGAKSPQGALNGYIDRTRRNARRTQDKDLDVDQNLDARNGDLDDPDGTDETYQAFAGIGDGRIQRGARRELRAGTESGRDAIPTTCGLGTTL